MIREDKIFRAQKYMLERFRNVENWKVRWQEEWGHELGGWGLEVQKIRRPENYEDEKKSIRPNDINKTGPVDYE
jgi:hypothetical protein